MPLVPQLRSILIPYLVRQHAGSSLLFPSRSGGRITDIKKTLDEIGARVGFEKNEIGTTVFRHTLRSAALQTLDGGHPVSKYTMSKWLGHGGARSQIGSTGTSETSGTAPKTSSIAWNSTSSTYANGSSSWRESGNVRGNKPHHWRAHRGSLTAFLA